MNSGEMRWDYNGSIHLQRWNHLDGAKRHFPNLLKRLFFGAHKEFAFKNRDTRPFKCRSCILIIRFLPFVFAYFIMFQDTSDNRRLMRSWGSMCSELREHIHFLYQISSCERLFCGGINSLWPQLWWWLPQTMCASRPWSCAQKEEEEQKCK